MENRSINWGRVHFRNQTIFYLGCLAVLAGAAMHLPMFFEARAMDYKLVGMPVDNTMIIGMFLIMAGILGATWGVIPKSFSPYTSTVHKEKLHIIALDGAKFNKLHFQVIIALSLALIIDIMKPASLSFVVPGMKAEYGIDQPTVALLPFVALTGTTVGSFLWGWLGDIIGRRATILLSAIIFMGTSICGAMPSFYWNLVMCFFMGLSAGGLLPVTTALLGEVIPIRHRVLVLVGLGGIGALGGYLAASGCAALFEPSFGWRIMWLLGLPTGAVLILLNRYIPESPRFLISQGRLAEADYILQHFNAAKIVEESTKKEETIITASTLSPALFKKPYLSQSFAIIIYGIAWGLVNFGFLLWLPSNLRSAGYSVGASDAILAKSALVAILGIVLVIKLYNWSSKWSLILFSAVTALTLLGFIPLAYGGAYHHTNVLIVLVVTLLISSTGMITSLSPYCVEIYPTKIRSTASGLAAGSGKFGGMFGVTAVLAHVTPTLVYSSFLVAIPVLVATFAFSLIGVETSRGGRSLEETSTIVWRNYLMGGNKVATEKLEKKK